MTLNNTPTIIYTATGTITVTLVLTNTTNSQKELNVQSSSAVYNKRSPMGEFAFTQWDIPLIAGEVIVAYSNVAGAINYVVKNGAIDITPAPVTDTSLTQILTVAQTAVGVTLNNLTAAQVRSLMAILLYKEGGVNPVTLQVKPLNQWVK